MTSSLSLAPDPSAPGDGATGWATETALALVANVEQVVRGRDAVVEQVVCGLLAGGHVLLEDLPGTGKTTLARALARSVDADVRRVQGTADLLPSDLTGSGAWDPERRSLVFSPGPVFAHVLLVDELNRTPPRCQSALLEAMEEHAVTVDGVRHPLPDPFFVVATQNPVDQHGTYPLPEGQLDRFALRVTLGPLDAADERRVVAEQVAGPSVDRLAPVLDLAGLRRLRDIVRAVHVGPDTVEYAVDLVRRTRTHPQVVLGASSRAAITLVRCAQALAVLSGRDFVAPDEVRRLAVPVLAHRLTVTDAAYAGGPGDPAALVVQDLVAGTPVPVRP